MNVRVGQYLLLDDTLYKRSFTLPLLKCLSKEEADYVLQKIHEGICKNHSGDRAMAHKAIRIGYYLPLIQKDVNLIAQKCDKSQRFANIPKKPVEELVPITMPWPFFQWGINIVGLLRWRKG